MYVYMYDNVILNKSIYLHLKKNIYYRTNNMCKIIKYFLKITKVRSNNYLIKRRWCKNQRHLNT